MDKEVCLILKRPLVRRVLSDKLFTESVGHIVPLSELDAVNKLRQYVLTANQSDVTFLVDIECDFAVSGIKKVLSKVNSEALGKLKVIVISSMDSWGGKICESEISDLETAFQERVPLAAGFNTYTTENQLIYLAKRNSLNVCVVGLGLVYGGYGFDFADVFRSMWNSSSRTTLACSSAVKPPMVHYQNFIGALAQLISCDGHLPQYYIIADRSSTALYDVLIAAEQRTNNSDGINVSAVQPEQFSEQLCANPCATSWNCDICLASGQLSNMFPVYSAPTIAFDKPTMSEGFPTLWAEFLASSSLSPIYISIVGPPSSGKTDAALALAEKLEVEYVSVVTAARFLVSTELPASGSIGALSQSGSADLRELQRGFAAEIRAKVAEAAAGGKKPTKGQPAAVASDEEGAQEPIDPEVLTEALCRSLTETSLRRCVLAMLRLHSRCLRRGCVLDLWDGRVMVDQTSLLQVLGMQDCTDPAAAAEDPQAGANVEGEQEQVQVQEHTPDSAAPSDQKFQLDLLVELQCEGNAPVAKLTTSFGAQVKAKESQAAIKALEATVTAYNAALESIESPDTVSEGAAEHIQKSHKEVLAVEKMPVTESAPAAALSVKRIDCGALNEDSCNAGSIAQDIFESISAQRGNQIGWLNVSSMREASSVESVFATEQNDASLAEAPTETPTETPTEAQKALASEGELDSSDVTPVSSQQQAAAVELPLAEQLRTLNNDSMAKLKTKSTELEDFLNATVLAQITSGMVTILREQPEDPIKYLSEYLRSLSEANRATAEESARVEFEQLLHGQ